MITPKEIRKAAEWLEIAPMSHRQIELIQADVLEWCMVIMTSAYNARHVEDGIGLIRQKYDDLAKGNG